MENYINKVIEIVDLSQNKPLNEIIYKGLREAIIIGIIPVGAHINEKAYADYMNISRTPIRKAIERLKQEELIEYKPNYGAVVKKVTVDDAKEFYEIRKILDVLATTKAMDIMDNDDFKKMERYISKANMAHSIGDADTVIEASAEFNRLMYQFAKMPKLIIIIDQLREYLSRFRNISLYDKQRRAIALHEHELIFKNMKAGNKDEVTKIINKHLDDSLTFVTKEIIAFDKGLNSD